VVMVPAREKMSTKKNNSNIFFILQ
jgi:hypothetical protein